MTARMTDYTAADARRDLEVCASSYEEVYDSFREDASDRLAAYIESLEADLATERKVSRLLACKLVARHIYADAESFAVTWGKSQEESVDEHLTAAREAVSDE